MSLAGQTESAEFIAQHGWPPERMEPFPADWSARRYARVRRDTVPYTAILMQAKPDADFLAFIRVARVLRGLDCAAPEIYAADTVQGFLLLEDFGDRNFGRLLDGGAEALPLLRRAVEALCRVQRRTLDLKAPDLPRFDAQRFIALLEPLLENFSYHDVAAARAEHESVWRAALAPLAQQPQALLLRDFIADNLMDIPARADGQTVGLLDFELAGIGPLAYDLISLTEQVRRDLTPDMRQEVHDYYLAQWPELDTRAFHDAMAVLSVQRHVRHFARLKKMQRPEFYARVRSFLCHELQHPACARLRDWFSRFLPQIFA